MGQFSILDATDPSDWEDWADQWHRWPEREVFAHPKYIQLYAARSSRPMCAIWESDTVNVLYPFVLRDLQDEPFWHGHTEIAYDTTSAYGYAGPFVWGAGDRACVAQKFWSAFESWAVKNNVASEFVRFSLFTDQLLSYPGERWSPADHIIRPLDADESVIWMEFEHKVRKNVNKAVRSAVSIEIDQTGERLPDFLRIYEHTMNRRHALEMYHFSRAYFEQIHSGLAGNFIYFHALLDGAVISTELVLVSECAVYSFLGGTEEECFALRPNDLLKFSIIKWAKQQRKRAFVLGGGYQRDDGIYRYKQAFAPAGQAAYYLGGRIFDRRLYDLLVEARRSEARSAGEEWEPRKGFFPAYRY